MRGLFLLSLALTLAACGGGGAAADAAAAWPAFDANEHYLELTLPIAAQTGYRQSQCQTFAALF